MLWGALTQMKKSRTFPIEKRPSAISERVNHGDDPPKNPPLPHFLDLYGNRLPTPGRPPTPRSRWSLRNFTTGSYTRVPERAFYFAYFDFDPSPSNIHKMRLNDKTNFDDKIIIYIEFCIRKIIFNFWGALFLGISPPKISTFSGSDSAHLERVPPCSARQRTFQNLYVLL